MGEIKSIIKVNNGLMDSVFNMTEASVTDLAMFIVALEQMKNKIMQQIERGRTEVNSGDFNNGQ